MISLVALMIAAQSAMPVQPASSPSAGTDADRLNQIVCHQRPATGSRLRSTRVCRTRQEWNTSRENITRGMQDYVTRQMTNQRPPETTGGGD